MKSEFWFLLVPISLFCKPVDPKIVHGSAHFEDNASTFIVHARDSTVIDWKSFSIAEGEITRFVLSQENGKILNRVIGSSVSEILGRLDSNGKFYLINRNGILFGPNAVINTKTALFSTLDVSNDDFLKGEEMRFIGKDSTKIVNDGNLFAQEEFILISRHIENNGKIEGSAKATLVAAEEVLIKPVQDSFYIRPLNGEGEVVNQGDIEALKVEILTKANPYTLAISQEDKPLIAVERGGRIYLCEGTIRGEEIEVKGDLIHVQNQAQLIADAKEQGNGGKILVIAEDLHFQGLATALGGNQGGDGGFIEISGHRTFIYEPKGISTLAPVGKTGMLLLDPNDIIINLAGPTSGGFSNPYSGTGFQPATLKISDLVGALATSDVTVQTSAATAGGSGDITIADPITSPNTWASSHTLTLLPSRDLNVNALVEPTGGGSVVVTAGRDINVGNAASATACSLQMNTGNLTLTAGRDLNVTGGTGLGAFAEASSINGTITCSVVNDVNVAGGMGGGSYAQIGRGIVSAATSITSNISFTSVGNNVTLTGHTVGVGSYAQIGHAPNGPGMHTVTSNITVLSDNTLSLAISLTGNAANSSAIIGHGNELSPNLISVTSSLDIEASLGISLTAGAATGSHAVIGFVNPNMGGAFTCISPSFKVSNFIANDYDLTAGTGSNAVIGYYNNAVSAGPSVNITLIDMQSPTNSNVNLIAGEASGMFTGDAVIGTMANLGTAESGIQIITGTLNMNNAAPIGGGAARIVNCLPTSNVSFDVTIQAKNMAGTSNILGGTTSPSNFSEIYSGQNLNLTFLGNLVVNNTLQDGFAQIRASSLVSLNPNDFGGTITMAGSSIAATGYALIQAMNGPVQLGTSTKPTGSNVTIGDITSIASSRIVSQSGSSIFNTSGGDFTLTGGTGASQPTAEIFNNLGPITINGHDMTLTGGSGMLAFAQIASNSGDLSINLSHNLVVQGGSATQAYAQIGKGFCTTETQITSNINFPVITNNVQITGGSAPQAYAQVGHSPFNNTSSINVNGDLNFGPGGIDGSLTLQGGTAPDATAIIGFGNELSTNVNSYTGNIQNLVVSGDVQLLCDPGNNVRTHAIIGYHSPTTVAAAPLTVTANNPGIFLKNFGSITGTARNGSNATIGYYNATNNGAANVTVNSISITSTHTITFQAGNNNGTGAGIAAIGTFAGNGGATTHSNITINATTVSLLGPTGGTVAGNDGAARCVNSFMDFSSSTFPSSPFDITMNVTDLLVYGGTGKTNGFADVYSSENLSVVFTNNLEVNRSAVLQNGYSHVIGFSDVNLGSIGNLISVIGGAFFVADARIQSINGILTHGNFPASGALNINVGQANSLSTSQVITSPGMNNINAANNFTIHGGAGTNCVSLIRTDSGPFFVSAGGSLTITGGTGGDFASAEIRSLSGTGQVNAGLDMILQGGGNTLTFAQINSDTGSITFPNISHNLTLTGGPAGSVESYAQIGKGQVASATTINSNLTFVHIGNNLTINGGAGTDCYAQIGHSPYFSTFAPPAPFAIDVFGNITINCSGKITLNGSAGPGINTTAIIGHGNELTQYLRNCIGSISIHDTGIGGIELNPGAPLLNTHAVIGFHSPATHIANAVTFNVNSPIVDVETSFGPILVNGGDRENAIIGYYNDTTPALTPPGVNVNITNLTVKCSIAKFASNNITLQAGNNAGSHNGVAIIGTLVASGNSAVSTINGGGNIINVLGPVGANDGQALITNNNLGAIHNLNVTLNTNTTSVFGGTGAATGLAEIYSSARLFNNFTTALNVGENPASPGTLAHANSLVRAFSDISMNPLGSQGKVTVVGGNAAAVLTDISSMAGNISIGNTLNAISGASDINVGTSAMIGSARIFAVTANVSSQASGNTTIQGGASANALADIFAGTTMNYNTGGLINITGGSISGAFARIASSSAMNTVLGSGGINLTGGVVGAYAEISNLGFGNKGLIVRSGSSGDIIINSNARIQNEGSGFSNVVSGHHLILNGDGFIQNIKAGGQLQTFSGVDTILNDTSRIEGNGSVLNIVVDNNFPTPESGVGPGRFVTAPGASIINHSPIRIFTAKRPQNSIQSTINGFTFIPGPEFVNSPTEQWGVYYPSLFGGFPFTIFYKDFIPVGPIPPIINNNSTNTAQFAQNLQLYDYLIMQTHVMTVGYEFCQKRRWGTCLDRIERDHFWRQLYRNYNTKILDTLD